MSTLTSRRCHKTAWKSQKQATSVKSGRHRPFFFAKRRSLPDRARIPARYIVVGIVGLTRLTTLQHASVCLFQIIERRIPIGAVVQFLLEYFQSGLAIVNNLRPGSDPNSAAQIRTLLGACLAAERPVPQTHPCRLRQAKMSTSPVR